MCNPMQESVSDYWTQWLASLGLPKHIEDKFIKFFLDEEVDTVEDLRTTLSSRADFMDAVSAKYVPAVKGKVLRSSQPLSPHIPPRASSLSPPAPLNFNFGIDHQIGRAHV